MTLPSPLTPEDCDLRGMKYMPLEVARVLNSDLLDEATSSGFRAAVILWCRAWHEVPAASLPAKETKLAKMVGVSMDEWAAIRKHALHGFVECSDGRLYHPVIATHALESYEMHIRQSSRANKRWEKERALRAAVKCKVNEINAAIDATALPRHKDDMQPAMPTAHKIDANQTKPIYPLTTFGECEGESDQFQGKKPPPKSRPFAIPEDWTPSPELVSYGVKNCGLIEWEVRAALIEFVRYWRERTDKARLKTERGWVQTAQGRLRTISDSPGMRRQLRMVEGANELRIRHASPPAANGGVSQPGWYTEIGEQFKASGRGSEWKSYWMRAEVVEDGDRVVLRPLSSVARERMFRDNDLFEKYARREVEILDPAPRAAQGL